MKNLKRLISILLIITMLAGVSVIFSSCGKATKENPGAVFEIYAPYSVSFDPATAYADEASAMLVSLLYQGLTKIDSNGKLKGALADKWRTYTDRDGSKVLEIKLKDTMWDDGISVDSTDFVDAWERILDPAFNCEAASLLFAIKNAVDVKNGDASISDLGLSADSQDTLSITLEDWADPNTFLRNCASVALFPIRKDVINKIYDKENMKENDWSTLATVIQTNGPFCIKKVSFGSTVDGVSTRPYITLERNKSYYLDPEKNESLDKYVVPHSIVINMTYGNDDVESFVDAKYGEVTAAYYKEHGTNMVTDVSNSILASMTEEEKASYGKDLNKTVEAMAREQIREQIASDYSLDYADELLAKITENKLVFSEKYNEGSVLYNTSFSLSEDVSGVKTKNSMMTGSFYFNTENELLAKPEVRKALSLALDREYIASMLKYAEAADTLITSGVFETTRKTSFKKNSSDYAISTSADIDAAKSLLASVGVSGGELEITIRETEADILIAKYAAEEWAKLGFDVKLKICGYSITAYTEKQLVATDKKDETGKTIKEWQDVIIYDGLLHDNYNDIYNSGDFDIIFYDVNMLSTDAFPALAQFAAIYSGRSHDFSDPANFDKLSTHITGYYNSEYDELMSKALVETDAKERAKLLHEAEALLLSDMPMTPVIYYKTAYKISSELDDFKTNYFGAPVFTEVSYDDYVQVEETEETTTTAPTTQAPATSAD